MRRISFVVHVKPEKQAANTHPTKAFMSTTRVLELLHMDLFGPTTYKSLGENLYCLVIVDDYSRYTWVFFLHDKSVMLQEVCQESTK